MATIVLSAVGAAAGGSAGGGVLGLSSVVIGRAIGATIGQVIDQRLLGSGSERVETGKIERFRLTGASEGAPISQIYGRMRVAGQVIWASQFKEHIRTSGGDGGKGAPKQPEVKEHSYSVSIAIALCEGVITRVGRIWADGQEIARRDLNFRVYSGSNDQMPDPKIEAVEGPGNVPAYRGIAYVVIEDLSLGQFGNRLPQLSFEVMRPKQHDGTSLAADPAHGIRGVALIPGSGEYALATEPVYVDKGPGKAVAANINSPSSRPDFLASLDGLRDELPNCGSISMVVSWFADDLRVDRATIRPKVEQNAFDAKMMPWSVSGLTRQTARLVPHVDGRPVYGGTPTDRSVVQAIKKVRSVGKKVVYYPFILMDQVDGNNLMDPWNGSGSQPSLPWRGRMTLSVAPGQSGSPDKSAAADAEVAQFFGAAENENFQIGTNGVAYTGPAEWSYRRFILHQAYLCAAAGGVDAFCIGSEMRGLTQIRGPGNSFPAVAALRALAADVSLVLGPDTKIGYAADWTEYFGYHPQDGTGDVFFHLDALWADESIDFVGIDNYMPLSDWRGGIDHADADWGSIYNTDYLKSNIAGGEGFDWYYRSSQAAEAQIRSAIEDGAYAEPWVFRYKDIKGWWSNDHFDRVGGIRVGTKSDWVPGSKPIWFTEYGCAAVDKGTNQPNRFLDPRSSESSLPSRSDGRRDELIQMQYLRAMIEFWDEPENNPVSPVYGERMVDMANAHVWAWDARPFPFFPQNTSLWSDGQNYYRGHWINGRTASRSLADVVEEICVRSGVASVDTTRLYGYLRGYSVAETRDARAALQPLMLAFGFESIERGGRLIFQTRTGQLSASVDINALALSPELSSSIEHVRAPHAEVVGRLQLSFVDADGDYDVRAEEALFPDDASQLLATSEMPILLTRTEGRAITERWLAEARVARDGVKFSLPLSELRVGAGDVLVLSSHSHRTQYRVDRVVNFGSQLVEAVRVESDVYRHSNEVEIPSPIRAFMAPTPVFSTFLDLPLLTGEESEVAPHLAVTANPWPGSVAVYSSATGHDYTLNRLIRQKPVVGFMETPLLAAAPGILDRGAPFRVRLLGGALSSALPEAVANGANTAAIGDGTPSNWEVLQFTDARLVEENTYEISGRLRGQAGTDALPSLDWPTGSYFVLLDGGPQQIQMKFSERGLERHYRIGPARQPIDDPAYTENVISFEGVGLRPYAPTHLKARRNLSGDIEFSWVRRTRIDGDSWQSLEVPLGEDREEYVVRLIHVGLVVREITASTASWIYTLPMQVSDGVSTGFSAHVAQLSNQYGAGLFRRIDVNV